MDDFEEVYPTYTVDSDPSPLQKSMHESTERMQTALLSASMDSPNEVVTAMRQVSLLRAHHQVMRIVQFLQLMDKLEAKMYEAIELDMATMDLTDSQSWKTLLTLQTKLQENIVNSNKLLMPFLEMGKYPIFNEMATAADSEVDIVIDLPPAKRNQLRENAESILAELEDLDLTVKA